MWNRCYSCWVFGDFVKTWNGWCILNVDYVGISNIWFPMQDMSSMCNGSEVVPVNWQRVVKERESVDNIWTEDVIYFISIRLHLFYQWNCVTLKCVKLWRIFTKCQMFCENMKHLMYIECRLSWYWKYLIFNSEYEFYVSWEPEWYRPTDNNCEWVRIWW